jgi:hypothetical protein
MSGKSISADGSVKTCDCSALAEEFCYLHEKSEFGRKGRAESGGAANKGWDGRLAGAWGMGKLARSFVLRSVGL